MKAKRLCALLMSFVMLLSMLPGTALAAEEPKLEVRLTEETLADKAGVAVELYATSGVANVTTIDVALVYDATMLEVVDATGAAIALPEVGTSTVLGAAKLETYAGFDTFNQIFFLIDQCCNQLRGINISRTHLLEMKIPLLKR